MPLTLGKTFLGGKIRKLTSILLAVVIVIPVDMSSGYNEAMVITK